MVDLPSIDMENAGSVIAAAKSGDVCRWFSDALAVKYAGNLRVRYAKAKTPAEKEWVRTETQAVLALYSICAYYIYPNSLEFKKRIGDSKEYRKNFSRIKKWLEANEGKQIADEFFSRIMEIRAERSKDN